jgi:hypothetical protein
MGCSVLLPMGTDNFGRKPHTARERVESLGADNRGADRIRART